MTRRAIEITFGNAIAQARQLEECAADMERLAQQNVPDISENIRNAWQGTAADAYLRKVDMTANNMLVTARKIRSIATTLRNVATIFRNTELRALEIVEQRTY